MLTLTGQVMNVFTTQAAPDKKTGEVYQPKTRVQIMGEIPVRGGDVRMEMVTLSCGERGNSFKVARGKRVRCHVGLYEYDGGAVLTLVNGAEIELINEKGDKTGLLDDLKPDAKRAA